jgi:hypothetical protein
MLNRAPTTSGVKAAQRPKGSALIPARGTNGALPIDRSVVSPVSEFDRNLIEISALSTIRSISIKRYQTMADGIS